MTETSQIVAQDRDLARRIGIIVKGYRQSTGRTQAQLAEQAGVTQGAVSHVEKGRRCQLDTVDRIANALGYPLSRIIQRAEQMESVTKEDLKRRYLEMRKRHLGR